MSNGSGILDNPLTEDHLLKLNEGLEAVARGLRQAELASRAGIDVASQKRSLEESRDKILQIKQVYFPGR